MANNKKLEIINELMKVGYFNIDFLLKKFFKNQLNITTHIEYDIYKLNKIRDEKKRNL